MSRKLVGALALFVVFTLGGCEDSAGVGGPGSLSIFLTDNPAFLEAWVTIERIELVGGGEGDGIQVLWENTDPINLLTLANEAFLLVDGTTVEATTYSQLRFIVPEACIVIGEVEGDVETPTAVYASTGYTACDKGGITTEDLQLPSFGQTGIKVQLPHEELVVTEEGQALLVDFDVSESFGHEAGNSDKWVMHPVIKAEDMSLSRSITVELTLGEGMTLPQIMDGETVVVAEPTLADYFQASLGPEETPVDFTCPEGQEICTATFLYLVPGDPYLVYVDLKAGLTLDHALDPESPQQANFDSEDPVVVSFVVNPLPPTP